MGSGRKSCPPGRRPKRTRWQAKKSFSHIPAQIVTRVEGTVAQATIGPDLTRIASRKEIGAGVLENSTENLDPLDEESTGDQAGMQNAELQTQ